MGYKIHIHRFIDMHEQWITEEYWQNIEDGKLFEEYGQAKLDCLLAPLKCREELVQMGEPENPYEVDLVEQYTHYIEIASDISEKIDQIMITYINW